MEIGVQQPPEPNFVQEIMAPDQTISAKNLASKYFVKKYDSLCPEKASKWTSSYLCQEVCLNVTAI